MHPATKKFQSVEKLETSELRRIVNSAPSNWLLKTPREKDALRELMARQEN